MMLLFAAVGVTSLLFAAGGVAAVVVIVFILVKVAEAKGRAKAKEKALADAFEKQKRLDRVRRGTPDDVVDSLRDGEF